MSNSQHDRSVFVVHGRNTQARDAMFEFLRALGLFPIEWSDAVRDTGSGSPYIGQVLDAAMKRAQAIVVLLTPDDEVRLSDRWQRDGEPPHETQMSGQARPNVLFEAGMAMGRNEKGTVLVELGELRRFSDIDGRHVVRLNDSREKRRELARRLETAGCAVNLDGDNWCSAGRFDSAIVATGEPPRRSSQPLPPLSESAADMLRRASALPQGKIRRWQDAHDKWHITAGVHEFDMSNARAAARSNGALDALVKEDMVRAHEAISGVEWVHEVTDRGFRWIDDDKERRRRSSPSHSLSEDAWEILQVAARGNGEIVYVRRHGELYILVGERLFDTTDPRLEAKWDGAVLELIKSGLVEWKSKTVLSVNRDGYALVDGDR